MSDPQNPGKWTSTQAYLLSVICLVLGVAIGYLARGSAPAPSSAQNFTPGQGAMAQGEAPGVTNPQQPTPEQLRHMADVQAEPLLAKLKTDPNNAQLCYQVGNLYYDAQQYSDAVRYYEESLKIDPNATDVRTDLGTAYHLMGQPDRALQEYEKVLKTDGKHANALFNEGMVKWQDKMDLPGAIASWKRLLEAHPDYPQKDRVQQLIAQAEQHQTMQPGTKTNKPANIAQ